MLRRIPRIAGAVVLLLLAACQTEPRTAAVSELPRHARWLGLPARVLEPGAEGGLVEVTPLAVDLTTRIRVPGETPARATPDSISVVLKGKPLRLVATLPPHEDRDLAGIRLRYRGTLGGRLGLSWREGREQHFRRALVGAEVPGGGRATELELGLGTTRILDGHVSALGIELPATEVGTASVADVRLLLRPGGVTHRVDLDGDLREVLAPGPRRTLEWEIVVPDSARVTFDYATHPGMRVVHGDGTRFVAEIVDHDGTTRLLDRWLSVFAVPGHRGWQSADLDLSAWAGHRVTLRLSTLPGPEAHGVFPASAELRDDDPLFTLPRLVAAADPRPNVLLIVVDTLRRDALGAYGGGPSAVMDSLAAAGIRYDRAWAAGSWTHPSVTTLLSGWEPSRHGLGFGPAGTTRRHEDTPMLAADLRAAGWETAAISNNKIVSVEDGFAEGFTTFDQTTFVEDQVFGAERVTRAALDWVDDHPRQPWMLYLHYFDPHDRYQAPPPWTRMHVDQGADRRIRDSSVRGGRPNTFMEDSPARRDLSGEELRYLRDLYRGEVSYLDHWLGRLLAGLRARGDLDRTIVVLTSDHGEEFLEHDGLKHGHTLYEELVAVPLVVLHPDGPNAGGVVSTPVSLQGLAPTLREWTGVAPVGAEGVWPLDEAPAPRPVAENWRDGEGPRAGPQRAVWDWPLKLIDVGDGRRLELYDLVADPGEQEPRDDPAGIGRLTAVLDSILGAVDVSVEDAEVDPALLEKLKAMGYVH